MDLFRNAVPPRKIFGEDPRTQAINGGICHFNRLFFCIKRDQGHDGPEHFDEQGFNAMVWAQDKRWLPVRTGKLRAEAAKFNLSALILGFCKGCFDFLDLSFGT